MKLFIYCNNEIQLYAVSENEVIADDLGSGIYLKFCLDGTVVWRKERKEEKTVLGSRFRKVTEGEKNCDIRFTEQEYQNGILRQQQFIRISFPQICIM